jgi:molybdopterin synthase sulfur carrier subunit
MARIFFTPNVQRHLACPPGEAAGSTVAAVLESYFAGNPKARGYVLDEQGALRPHMVIFVNNEPINDRVRLSDAVAADAEIFVMQALSGG